MRVPAIALAVGSAPLRIPSVYSTVGSAPRWIAALLGKIRGSHCLIAITYIRWITSSVIGSILLGTHYVTLTRDRSVLIGAVYGGPARCITGSDRVLNRAIRVHSWTTAPCRFLVHRIRMLGGIIWIDARLVIGRAVRIISLGIIQWTVHIRSWRVVSWVGGI